MNRERIPSPFSLLDKLTRTPCTTNAGVSFEDAEAAFGVNVQVEPCEGYAADACGYGRNQLSCMPNTERC